MVVLLRTASSWSIAIRYFGDSGIAVVRAETKAFEKCSFARCREPLALGTVTFEPSFALATIGESCYEKGVLDPISIRQSVQSLGKKCFPDVKIDMLAFERQSRLQRLEEGCFFEASAKSVRVPSSVENAARWCFSGSPRKKLTLHVGSLEDTFRREISLSIGLMAAPMILLLVSNGKRDYNSASSSMVPMSTKL
jgi:hypothetical protein